jgi:hypothetical protein
MTEERQKRIRLYVGMTFAALAAVVLVVGLVRDQPWVMAFGFVGGLVAGNVIPYQALKDLLPWGKS